MLYTNSMEITDNKPVYTYLNNIMQSVLSEHEYNILSMHCGLTTERVPMNLMRIGLLLSLPYRETERLYRQGIVKLRKKILEDDMETFVCENYYAYHTNRYIPMRVNIYAPFLEWEE